MPSSPAWPRLPAPTNRRGSKERVGVWLIVGAVYTAARRAQVGAAIAQSLQRFNSERARCRHSLVNARTGAGKKGDKVMLGLDISQIIDLGTQVATSGAIRALESTADDIFEYIIGMSIVVYEIDPG